jgi:hypothetical protein
MPPVTISGTIGHRHQIKSVVIRRNQGNTMHRRHFLARGAAIGTCISAAYGPGFAALPAASDTRNIKLEAWRKRITTILNKGGLPIIDTQATYVESATQVDQMISWMDELDVAQIAFAPAQSPDSELSLTLHRKFPSHFIPTGSSGEFARWWNNPAAFLDVLSRDLQTGHYFMMGEYEFRHYPSPEQVASRAARDTKIAIDGPAGHTLFQLSEKTGLSFQIHYEIEDVLLPALEAMLGQYPKALVIWSHLGMIRYPERTTKYNPAYVASLIERFPSLHFDLAVPAPDKIYAPSGARDSTLYADGQLAASWKAVLEKYPERFLAASDYRPAVEQLYPATIKRQRRLILETLSEPTRHKIAYGNAWRLLSGQAWS